MPLPDHTEDLPEENSGDDLLDEDKFGPEDEILGDLGDLSSVDIWLQRIGRTGRSVGIGFLVLMVLAGLVWMVLRIMEPRRMTAPQRGYYRMTRFARVLAGRSPGAMETPFEYGRVLAAEAPYAGDDILALVHLYVRDQFAATLLAEDAAQATILWRNVFPGLLRRAGERLVMWIKRRGLSVWNAIRRLGRPRTRDGNYAG